MEPDEYNSKRALLAKSLEPMHLKLERLGVADFPEDAFRKLDFVNEDTKGYVAGARTRLINAVILDTTMENPDIIPNSAEARRIAKEQGPNELRSEVQIALVALDDAYLSIGKELKEASSMAQEDLQRIQAAKIEFLINRGESIRLS